MDESLWDHLWLEDSGASIHLLSQSLIDSGHVVVVNKDFHEVRCSLASREVLNLSRLAAKGWSIGIESSGLRVSCLHGSYPKTY